MPRPLEDSATWLVSALQQLDGKAIGLWRVEADRLVQVCFQAPAIDPDVAQRFASATLTLGLDRLNLGIVQAASQQRTAVSIASQLPAETGSGYWLRSFGAERSVAVPLVGLDGRTRWVLSIALGLSPIEAEVADRLRSAAAPNLATLD